MRLCDWSFCEPQKNLALDEALLETAVSGQGDSILRFWESPVYFVVLGASCKLRQDVKAQACQHDGIPILRRISGGGTVLQGPGCLNYALVLRQCDLPIQCRNPGACHTAILKKVTGALVILNSKIVMQGVSDLTVSGKKFSGNALRRRGEWILYHGTLLYAFDCARIDQYLRHPCAEPAYRQGRAHQHFLVNLNATAHQLKTQLARHWHAVDTLRRLPGQKMRQLLASRYENQEWNEKF